jgi:hypothetical protein
MTPTAVARDARPPLLLVRAMNPVLRLALRSPLGWLIPPLVLLEFDGRRSGRRYRVPVGWHEVDGGAAVFTPAPWRANFAERRPVTVHHRGRRRHLTGTLETDPGRIAAALQFLCDQRGSPRSVGLAVPVGHRATEADVLAVNRQLIRFTDRVER